MLTVRALGQGDIELLRDLLLRERQHNVFHLSALTEYGISSHSWASGVFRGGDLVGAVMALRGTGGAYHLLDDDEARETLAEAIHSRVLSGRLGLLSGHASQLEPLLPLLKESVSGRPDRCYFFTLNPDQLRLPEADAQSDWYTPDLFKPPRRASDADMERLIDFYLQGFYSLANLPTRDAWRNRLSEQLAFRTLYLIEDRDGAVASAALSSAEGAGAAMLGGVATLDAYRGLGLSTLCVGALCRGLFNAGADSIGLFYLKDNAPAGRVYDKLGFTPAGEWLLAPVGPGFLFGA